MCALEARTGAGAGAVELVGGGGNTDLLEEAPQRGETLGRRRALPNSPPTLRRSEKRFNENCKFCEIFNDRKSAVSARRSALQACFAARRSALAFCTRALHEWPGAGVSCCVVTCPSNITGCAHARSPLDTARMGSFTDEG